MKSGMNTFWIFLMALLLVLPVGFADSGGSGSSVAACASSTIVSEGALGNPGGTGQFEQLGLDISSHPEILRYRIEWFGGSWSDWYVPGQGDVDNKTNLDGTQRRVWSYFDDHTHEYEKCLSTTQVNQPPVITGVSSPTQLKVGETGTWSVKAYDPENGQLSYSVIWGDEAASGGMTPKVAQVFTQTTTVTHSYSSAGTYTIVLTVQDDKGATAQSTTTVSVGSSACTTVPTTCAQGTTPVLSYYDSNGCPVYFCVPKNTGVGVELYAEPSEVNLYDSFQVYGTITYRNGTASASDSASNQKKFKVVTSLSDSASLAPRSRGVSLASSEGSIIDSVIAIVSGRAQANTETAAQQETSTSASSTSVAEAAVSAGNYSSQERVDYITLAPGQSARVSAYFTARTPGTKVVHMRVYEFQVYPCFAAPCRDGDYTRLVSQETAKVKVNNKEKPPQPPEPSQVTGTIAIQPGWNMVSVPVDSKISMQDLAEKCGTPNYAWRLTSSGYVKDDTLVPGYGYWIKASSSCSHEMNGDSYSTSIAELSSGWNLVGSPGTEVSISDYIGSCQITSGPWYYKPEQKEYQYSSKLYSGQAYWIKVASICSLGSTGDQPPQPPQ